MYDLIVIGAGGAGSSCAEKINNAGKHVALIERDALGGTCLNHGCDPTKTALYSAKILNRAQHGNRYGLNIADAGYDWRMLQQHIRTTQEQMRGGTQEEARRKMLERGIDLIIGSAQFISNREVTVDGRTLQAKQFLIATGAEPTIPEIPGLQVSGFVTNKNILDLPDQPHSLAIMGAGPVGVEFAQLFARLGSEVHLFEAESQILPKDDPDLVAELSELLEEEGLSISTQARITAVSPTVDGKQLTICYDSGYQEQLVVSELLLAAGRKPAVESLNLEAAGVQINEGQIVTDDSLQTTISHIWAAGDVTSDYPFTHVAWRQGVHVADNILKGAKRPFDRSPIPWVTYTDPELAHVGLTIAQVTEKNTPYRVVSLPLEDVARALLIGQTGGQIKLLVDEDDQLLGGHILAPHGGELLGPIILAIQANLPVSSLVDMVWPYPTLSAGLGHAAGQLDD